MGKRKGKKKGKAKKQSLELTPITAPRPLAAPPHVRRRFTAANAHPYRVPPIGTDQSADYAVQQAYTGMLAWSRHLDQNNGTCIGVLDEMINQIVGAGIRVRPDPRDAQGNPLPRLQREISELMLRWREAVDVTGELSEPAYERLECRAWLRDGDVFAQDVAGRERNYDFASDEIPYRVEFLETEWCPIDYDTRETGFRLGVQLDSWRRPRSYAIYKWQPNDYGIGTRSVTHKDLKRVRAINMAHLKFARRWPQTRGVSIFSGVLTTLHDLVEYEESERIAARVAASMTAFVRRDPVVHIPTNEQIKAAEQRELELQAGQIFDELLPGEEIGAVSVDRPNTALVPFRREMIRAICAGAGARYSPVARDFSGTYSSQRQELVEGQASYDYLRGLYVRAGPRRRHERAILAAVLDGQIAIPPGATLRSISRAKYRPPRMPWIDRLKEAQADKLELELGLIEEDELRDRRGALTEQMEG